MFKWLDYDAWPIVVQWLVFLPLFLISVVGALWHHYIDVRKGYYDRSRDAKWRQRSTFYKVFSTLSILEWLTMFLCTTFLGETIVNTFLDSA